ncbi:unnamed protein product [Closterium sp. NIES-54]
MFQHIKDLVELDDSGPNASKLLRDVIQPNTLPMVIVLEKELAALSMRPAVHQGHLGARQLVGQPHPHPQHSAGPMDTRVATAADFAGGLPHVPHGWWCCQKKLLRGMELQEALEEEGEGEGEAVGEALAEGEAEAGHPWFKCFSRPEGWARPGKKPPNGERARSGAVQGSGAQGDGAHSKANPGMFLMVEDVKGSEGDVGTIGMVLMHPLTHWVIDSGCTSHMTPRADLLDEVKPPGKIKFVATASGALLPVIGVGNAKVMGANGGLVGLGNVLLVEFLSANLLSVRRLQRSKAKVTFDPTSCRAKLGKLLLWNLEEKSSCIKDLWQLPIIPWNGKPPATAAAAAMAKANAGGEEIAPTDGALDAVKMVKKPQQPHGEVLAGVDATAAWAKSSSGSGEADWETWHERLCHVNFSMLQKLVKDGSLKGLKVKGAAKEVGSCPTFLETKFTKFPFSSGTGPAKAPLALEHMDVVGPTRAPSLSGSRYFLTIVDDHTRAVESGHKVKVIRTDNGGEFIGADFEVVLKKKGIQHQLTVPYNPQQNGVAERFNRTLQEGARTLLGRAGLPDPFWVTALRQVALVKNRVLATVGDKQRVPYTNWYGSALAVNMLRAYGCMVVFHVPKEKRGKLEASGRWGVHLGLAKDHKGWLIWDVKFLESLYYKEWKQQQQKLPTTPLIIEADEVQRPSRQVQVTVSDEEISGVTEDGGEPKVEEQQQQQQQQQDAPPRAQRPPDRPRRDVRPPYRLTYPSFGKPKVWKQSVKEEYDFLLENEMWELCELPPGKKAISSKLIFKHKYGPEGELTRYKSRLVAKGFQQTKGKDFDEIFATVGKGTTLRMMLEMAANRGWRIKQIDITTTFLNGIILEELYMQQPEGLDDGSGRVCRLKNAIYGLKQAPRAWYHKLEETLLTGGFKKSECDHRLFLLQEKNEFLMLLVYVDDILLFSELSAMIERVEDLLEMLFKCSKMGVVKYYLGMHVERELDKGVLRLHQRKYCEGLAEKYGLQDGGKPATLVPLGFTVEPCANQEVVGESDRKLFHSMVGALNYAANHTRPDIAFATSRLASVVSCPSHEQLEAAKRLVRYMSATASVGLEYSAVRQRQQWGVADLGKGEMLLTCYTDASFNSVKADGTSIGGYVCLFGGGAVSWRSKKQNEKSRKEKQTSKKTSSTKDVDHSCGKGRGNGEASCSMVGMVEPTVSLAPKASKDFQVVEAAVQANPMAVLLNSGCSHHLMGTKAAFVDMAPSDIVKHVCGFNGALQPVKGRGTIALQGEYRCVLIPDVLYVPGVNTNLLSAGQLKESEVQLQGDGDEMLLVATTGKVLGRARYTGRVLCTDLRPCSMRSPSTKVVALRMIVSATKSTLDRWHARLAHVGVDTIKSSAKHEVATGLDIKPSTGADPPCVSCVGGKLARHTFPNKGSDTKEALAVVHIDLCGPFWVAAKDGSLYFLLLKDRHTRLVWAMPVAKKSDVLREFQQWLVLVKRRTKKSVLMLRPDRGGEFIGKEITNFVNRKGIIHNLTCPYTPQQNGMAEREMRLVVESVQTMLLHMGVQNHWWHLAPRQAVWVRNCMALASGISPIKVSKRSNSWMVFHARLPPGAFTTLLEDAEADVDLPKLYPDVHADLKYRWDFATMTVKEALASWKRKAVKAAMDEEIRSLINMGTWELVERPRGVNIMKNRWVYDADCGETYSPVSSYVTLRIFLSIVAVLDLNLMQLDMKNTFLHNKLDQVLYMYQPDYFDDGTDRVCKLLKSLYELKLSE